ncbi:hypothetical protein Ocepr_2388 (plasmid) [Oceanithermus profundus DSM 14977]|uniref:Uncharacterized protein n=1 Tax=Oceanithermus profundus (strain DSM 14977 / NBRC 100410 / VKM B-2274 / 506) TaxID=670487 RepID=E4UAQ7_OCEP5|nr:hypothetical protein [Oceanithermus profundus]ADR37836.1 hypothetical protein Ocepr_2388 [Oceanithermus profundus DSM 14977]
MHETTADTISHLATNAPQDWPPIPFNEDAKSLTKLHLLTALEAGLRTAPGFRVSAQEHLEFFDRGMLRIDAVVEGPSGRWPVFLYPEANEAAARHFLAVTRYRPLSHRIGSPVYLARTPLPNVEQALSLNEVLRMDQLPLALSPFPQPGRYAMWFASPNDPVFTTSPVVGLIDDYYRRTRGLEGRLFAEFLVDAEITKGLDEALATVHQLGSRRFIATAVGPSGGTVAISYTTDRGLRIHVHERYAAPEYLTAVWRMMLLFARARLPKADPAAAARSEPYRWWRRTRRRAAEQATQLNMIQAVGNLKVQGG